MGLGETGVGLSAGVRAYQGPTPVRRWALFDDRRPDTPENRQAPRDFKFLRTIGG